MVRDVFIALVFAAAVGTGVFWYLAERRQEDRVAKELRGLRSQVRSLSRRGG
jgi:hypothetical protein